MRYIILDILLLFLTSSISYSQKLEYNYVVLEKEELYESINGIDGEKFLRKLLLTDFQVLT